MRFLRVVSHFCIRRIICLLQDLQVMKVRRPGYGIICFVAKLYRSNTSLPRAFLDDNNNRVSYKLEKESIQRVDTKFMVHSNVMYVTLQVL